jgi:hypothetical protein
MKKNRGNLSVKVKQLRLRVESTDHQVTKQSLIKAQNEVAMKIKKIASVIFKPRKA